jgi:hypothetical protein
MADGRSNNGGARQNAGRKPKEQEENIKTLLSPMDDAAISAIKSGIENGDFQYVKMFMEYRFGKPKETKAVDLTSNGETFSLKDLIKFE